MPTHYILGSLLVVAHLLWLQAKLPSFLTLCFRYPEVWVQDMTPLHSMSMPKTMGAVWMEIFKYETLPKHIVVAVPNLYS